MLKFDLNKGLVLFLFIFTAAIYSQNNTIRLTSSGVSGDEGNTLAQDDTVINIDASGVVSIDSADADYTLGSNTGTLKIPGTSSKSFTVRLKAGLTIDQTSGNTYGAIKETAGIDRANDGALGIRGGAGNGIDNNEGVTFGFDLSALPSNVSLQVTKIYFSTFGANENGVIVNRTDTSKKLDFSGPGSGTVMIKDVTDLDLFLKGGTSNFELVSLFNNSATVQSWRVSNIEFKFILKK